MPNDFADPNIFLGTRDPYAKPEPETGDRSIPRTVADYAIKIGLEPLLSAARVPTSIARSFGEDPTDPINRGVTAADRALAQAQKYVHDQMLSERAQALEQDKWIPGPDDRSAWREPIAVGAQQASGLVLPTVASVMTGGVTAPAIFGAMSASDQAAHVRDWVDNAPIAELQKLEAFRQAQREYPNDESAQRDKLARDSVDLLDLGMNFAAGAVPLGFIS